MLMEKPRMAPSAYAIFSATAPQGVYRDVNTNAGAPTPQGETPL